MKYIPEHLFTEEAFANTDYENETVWHIAAVNETLKDIPEFLFTSYALAQVQKYGETVWHEAARYGTLKYIPEHLFTKDVLNQKNHLGQTVWGEASENETLEAIPEHLFTEEILDIRDSFNDEIFNEEQQKFVKNVISSRKEMLNKFLLENPSHAKDIEFADPRLELIDVSNKSLSFRLDGTKNKIILSSEGAFVNKVNHEILNKAVLFIEKTHHSLEQSIEIPKSNNLEIKPFCL